jgi:hypothetical protein
METPWGGLRAKAETGLLSTRYSDTGASGEVMVVVASEEMRQQEQGKDHEDDVADAVTAAVAVGVVRVVVTVEAAITVAAETEGERDQADDGGEEDDGDDGEEQHGSFL